jgi:hypothetical protein
MKKDNKLLLLLVNILILSMVLIGCSNASDKIDEAINPPKEALQQSADTESMNNDVEEGSDLEARAKEEGISISEMEQIIDELTDMVVEKVGSTKEDYIEMLEKDNKTPFDEFKTAADFMGITIKEYYEYEKSNKDNMTPEQKEQLGALADAVKEAQNIEIPELGTTDVENMLGIYGKDSDEIREVVGDAREMFSYGVGEIIQDYEDEYSIVFEYTTDYDPEDLVSYYDELILNTKDYLKLAPAGMIGAMLQGTINNTSVYISIEEAEDGSGISVNTYIDLTTKQ